MCVYQAVNKAHPFPVQSESRLGSDMKLCPLIEPLPDLTQCKTLLFPPYSTRCIWFIFYQIFSLLLRYICMQNFISISEKIDLYIDERKTEFKKSDHSVIDVLSKLLVRTVSSTYRSIRPTSSCW